MAAVRGEHVGVTERPSGFAASGENHGEVSR